MPSIEPSSPAAEQVASRPDISTSGLVSGVPVTSHAAAADCRLMRVSLQDGIDLIVWKGELEQPMTMALHDDWDRIHFTCALQGGSQFSYEGGVGQLEHALNQGSGCINYNPGIKGRSSHSSKFESLTVSVRPDIFRNWAPTVDLAMQREIDVGRYYAENRCNVEMRSTAQGLSRAVHEMHGATNLAGGASQHAPLWMLGQSLVLVSLALETHVAEPASVTDISSIDRQRLLHARELLLADLSAAPTIAELASQSHLSMVKLKRGFRQLFNHSIYGLFQQERMHAARQRLLADDASVMHVAADFGYTNASHFAAAFQKQFGIRPSELKRRLAS